MLSNATIFKYLFLLRDFDLLFFEGSSKWLAHKFSRVGAVFRQNFDFFLILQQDLNFGSTTNLHKLSSMEFQLRADLEFSRKGGGGFSKNFQKFCRFFLDRPKLFSELSQGSKKTLFWPKFLRRRQIFKKIQPNASVFRHFLENLYQKNAFFRLALPPIA